MYDLIIIGSGPAGYVSAIRAGQLGIKTAIIERDNIGGMCLNWGCIPSKAILESLKLYHKVVKDGARFGIDGLNKEELSFNWNKALKRSDTVVKRLTGGVEYLLKKNGVEIIKGSASILSAESVLVENRLLETKNIIIATGSTSPPVINSFKGLVVEPKELFTEREIPQNIVIAGSSPVAVELAQAFNMMGKKVTILSEEDKIMLKADSYIRDYMVSRLKKDKIDLLYNIELTSTEGIWNEGILKVGESEVACDIIINAKSRKGNIPDNKIGLEITNGYISVDQNFETSAKGIYAVGDVNGLSMFAHVGSAQGLHVVNALNGVVTQFDPNKLPMNMYTIPEAAQIGLTEEGVKESGIDYKISEFPLSANGKAQTEGNAEGFIRIISEKKYGEVLGIQIVAPNATDMINEASAYMQLESTVYDIANTIHTHPTVSEVFMEAGFEAVDKAIHK